MHRNVRANMIHIHRTAIGPLPPIAIVDSQLGGVVVDDERLVGATWRGWKIGGLLESQRDSLQSRNCRLAYPSIKENSIAIGGLTQIFPCVLLLSYNSICDVGKGAAAGAEDAHYRGDLITHSLVILSPLNALLTRA